MPLSGLGDTSDHAPNQLLVQGNAMEWISSACAMVLSLWV
jgi:hypothetical protein